MHLFLFPLIFLFLPDIICHDNFNKLSYSNVSCPKFNEIETINYIYKKT